MQVIAPEEIVDPNVDEHSVMTYLSQFPKAKLKPGAPVRSKQLNPKKAIAYGPGMCEPLLSFAWGSWGGAGSYCVIQILLLLLGIEPHGNTVLQPAHFTVQTVDAGLGEVLVYIEDPEGHTEEVWRAPLGWRD